MRAAREHARTADIVPRSMEVRVFRMARTACSGMPRLCARASSCEGGGVSSLLASNSNATLFFADRVWVTSSTHTTRT